MPYCRSCHRRHAHTCRRDKPHDGTIVHGTRYTYVHHKCRCDSCRNANKTYAQVRLVRMDERAA